MKSTLFFCVAFFVIAFPAFSELDPQDLDKIRLIVKEEVAKEVSESEKRMKIYIIVESTIKFTLLL